MQGDGLGDVTVQLPPPRGADGPQHDVPQPVVAEVVGRAAVPDDVQPPQFVEVVGDVVLGPPGRGREDRRRELPADRRRDLGDATRGDGQSVEAGGDQGVDGRRQRDRSGRPAAEPRADRLRDEQRVALGLRPQLRRGLRGQDPSPDEGGHLGRRRAVQRPQTDHGRRELSAPPVEQLRSCGLFVPHRADDEDRCRRSAPDENLAQLHRVRVAPLEVVDDEQHRPAGGQEAAAPGDEEMMPPPGVRGRRGVRETGVRLPELGQQPGELGQAGGVQGVEAGTDRPGPQPVDHRAPRRAAGRLVGPAVHHRVAVAGHPPGQLLHEAGLADARLARDTEHARRGPRTPPATRRGPPATRPSGRPGRR